jgi:hypothetical protein
MLGVSDVSLWQSYGIILVAGALLFTWCLVLLHRGTGLRS